MSVRAWRSVVGGSGLAGLGALALVGCADRAAPAAPQPPSVEAPVSAPRNVERLAPTPPMVDPRAAPAAVERPVEPTPTLRAGARLQVGEIEARGDLAPAALRSLARAHLEELSVCYERALTERPTLTGRVGVQVLVPPDGRVTQPASFPFANEGFPPVEACFGGAIAGWAFPQRPSGRDIVVIFDVIMRPPS